MAGIKSTRETDRGAVIIVDSMMMRPDALRQNPNARCPQDILDLQVISDVSYIGFDGRSHKGQIVVDKRLMHDIQLFFEHAQKIEFPIEKVVPAVQFAWDDTELMDKNISSGFNFRPIAGTSEISLHGKGMAFDINPRNNPYIRYSNGVEIVSPAGAVHDLHAPGTLYADHPLVLFMKSQGWEWGGDWLPESGRVDYQHFQKNLDT
jgi:D-alanyl-D-alanine carboxypeptidase